MENHDYLKSIGINTQEGRLKLIESELLVIKSHLRANDINYVCIKVAGLLLKIKDLGNNEARKKYKQELKLIILKELDYFLSKKDLVGYMGLLNEFKKRKLLTENNIGVKKIFDKYYSE